MFQDLAAHDEMRSTPLPWASRIPMHWRIERAKALMSPMDVRSESGAEDLLTVSSSRGVVPRSSATVSMFKAESYVGHKLCWPNDLVINSLWAWNRGLGVARHHRIVSTAYGVYRQRKADLLPTYLHHLVRSDPFQWELQVRSQGVWKSRLQMTDTRWLDAPLLVPPAGEQTAIVKYLAHANARIDKAIAAKRRLIALVREQRSAVAEVQVVGAVPDRPRHKARIAWLGDVPEGWSVVRVKQVLCGMEQGWSPQCDAEQADRGEWGVLKVGCSNHGAFRPTENKRLPIELEPREWLEVKSGDLLVSRANTRELVGSAAVALDPPPRLIFSDTTFRLRRREGSVDGEFLALALATRSACGQIEAGAVGASHSMQNIGQGVTLQERFIVDVLESYTPIESYYKLVKTIEEDPEFDVKRASKRLRAFVEGNEHAIRLKAEIMVDHFQSQVIANYKVAGQARAMVVTSSIDRCIEYFHAIRDYLAERKSSYRAIVAFSGEHEYKGIKVAESCLNGFPSKEIADRVREDPYRILVCADKFQTGYDEPLLHTMYVDKTLSGVKAVQTLSRLNRAQPAKYDAFVLDFANAADDIARAFEPYYQTTVLSQGTDPNKLHDLVTELDGFGIYSQESVDRFVELFLSGADRDKLDPILDASVAEYIELEEEDDQVGFKGGAKTFLRTYNFLSAVMPFGVPRWEKLSIFLDNLVPKLPAPKEDDLSAGILETIDTDSYRVEKRTAMKIALIDEEGAVESVPASGGRRFNEPEMDRLSIILQTFNDLFGNIEWTDSDRVKRLITEEIPRKVAEDEACQNAKKNNGQANVRVVLSLVADDTQLFKQFSDNDSFQRWLSGAVFRATYEAIA